MTNVEVFFDYTCAFSDRSRHRLDALEDTTIVWWPFALLEQDARGGGPPVFGRSEHPDDQWLSALAVHEQVRSQGEDTSDARAGPSSGRLRRARLGPGHRPGLAAGRGGRPPRRQRAELAEVAADHPAHRSG